MYARMDKVNGRDDHRADHPGLMSFSRSTPGLMGGITLGQLAGPAELLLTFWDSRASAAGLPGPWPGAAGQRCRLYEIADAREGAAAAYVPSHALVAYFDGPRLPELAAAAERAWRERLWPAIRDVDGRVASYVLQEADLGTMVVHLGTSLETLETVGRAAWATELLPGEDPALLPGPDRIELHHVTAYQMAAITPAATPEGR
jgi:hypothetical protein